MSTFSDFEASPLGAGSLSVDSVSSLVASYLAEGVVSASEELESEPPPPHAARPRESATRAAMSSGFNSMSIRLPARAKSNQSFAVQGPNTLPLWSPDHEDDGSRSRSGC